MGDRPSLLVFGGASLDVLHFGGRTERSAGGAGVYTALAAHAAGARVTMIAPRPEPMPEELAPAARRLDWRGPRVGPQDLPSFEIAHLGNGATEMLGVELGAEERLSVEDLPAEPPAGYCYCIPLDPARQLAFLRWARGEGRTVGCGTYLAAVESDVEGARAVARESDLFFCNQAEAVALFGSLARARAAPGKLLFVTRGPLGVRVLQGDHLTELPAPPVEELDATGAGDTLCGTVLAALAGGEHPLEAARRGVAAAARMVTGIGPEKVLEPSSPEIAGARARVDEERVATVASLLAGLDDFRPHDFLGPDLPPAGDPGALDFFFTATLQQFGFWSARQGRYRRPMLARLGGRRLKGSDYLWAAYRRWLEAAPSELEPGAQADLAGETLARRLGDDEGGRPLPQMKERLLLARAYGREMEALGFRSPADLVRRANDAEEPQAELFSLLDRVGGYKEDPLRKKSGLLAAILRQRPEGFLRETAEELPPIVDYHVQRSCLRLGLVSIREEGLARRLTRRELVSATDEEAVRRACHEAMKALRRASGRSMGAIDWFFFQNRSRCPEMEEPVCARCVADPVCAHRTSLFQPVFRTTFY